MIFKIFFSSSLASDRFSRTENIQKNKDQAHRLKGVLQDSIVMLEQVSQSAVPQGCEWAGPQLVLFRCTFSAVA